MAEQKPKTPSRHPFLKKLLINLLLIFVAGIAIAWIALCWLDSWTAHGNEVATPSVEGMSYSAAVASLNTLGFSAELIDSVYDSSRPPGTVTDQNPKAGAIVKEGREVYLTITAFSPKMVSLPAVVDVSERQARAILAGVGLNNISTISVPSEYKDLVAGVLVNGQRLDRGARIPVTARITLEVGAGPSEASDSIDVAEETIEISDL